MKKLIILLLLFAGLKSYSQTPVPVSQPQNFLKYIWVKDSVRATIYFQGTNDTLATQAYVRAHMGAGASGIAGFGIKISNDSFSVDTTKLIKQDSMWVVNDTTFIIKINSRLTTFHMRGAVVSFNGRVGAIVSNPADYAAFYVSLTGSYNSPVWLNSLDWTKLTGVPSTLLGYGIIDGVKNLGGSATWQSGTFAGRPAAGNANGAFYMAKDTNAIYFDNGASWQKVVGGGSGGSDSGIVATSGILKSVASTTITLKSDTSLLATRYDIARDSAYNAATFYPLTNPSAYINLTSISADLPIQYNPATGHVFTDTSYDLHHLATQAFVVSHVNLDSVLAYGDTAYQKQMIISWDAKGGPVTHPYFQVNPDSVSGFFSVGDVNGNRTNLFLNFSQRVVGFEADSGLYIKAGGNTQFTALQTQAAQTSTVKRLKLPNTGNLVDTIATLSDTRGASNIYNSNGLLAGPRTVDMNNNDLLFTNTGSNNQFQVIQVNGINSTNVEIFPSVFQVSNTDGTTTNTINQQGNQLSLTATTTSGSKLSQILVYSDTLKFKPHRGMMNIDSLQTAANLTNKTIMLYDTTNGNWSRIRKDSIILPIPPNLGSAFRIWAPQVPGFKTLNCTGCVLDSVTSGQIGISVSTNYVGRDTITTITSGTSSTVPDGTNVIQFNPTSPLTYTLTLATNWHSSHELLIACTSNGTITNGNPMVTLTIVNGSGHTQSFYVNPNGVTYNAGENVGYKLIGTVEQRIAK